MFVDGGVPHDFHGGCDPSKRGGADPDLYGNSLGDRDGPKEPKKEVADDNVVIELVCLMGWLIAV